MAVDKTVTIKAAPGATPVVDAGSHYPAFLVHASNVRIEGFTVRNGGPSYSGFYVSGSAATILNNRISGCGWGIFLTAGRGSTISGNTVDGSSQVGICLRSSNSNTVKGNIVTNCGKGLSIEGYSTGNTIYFNDFNNGYSVSGVTNKYNAPSSQTFTFNGKAWTGILGNHWGNYQSTDENGNGLGDAVYTGNGFKDYYPLMDSIAKFTVGGSVTPSPTGSPTISPTARPTVTPTPRPTVTVTPAPTISPTARPTVTPTPRPTTTPNPGSGPIQIDASVPANAVRVASQTDINNLPGGANAVLTADLSAVTLSKAVNLFGNGHRVGTITLAASGARVSGFATNAIVIKAGGTTVDHCTVTSTSQYAIRADNVDNVRILSNTIAGSQTANCCGVYATNCDSIVIDGNTCKGAYFGFYTGYCSNSKVSYNYVGHASGYRQGGDFYTDYGTGGVYNNNEIEFNPYSGTGAAQDHDGYCFNHCDGVTIDGNKVGGHYYALKVYNSKNCVIQNNNLYRVGSLRTGFYDSNLIVRNNKVQGQVGTQSVGLYINDGITNSRYENNEVWDCNYGVQVSHYPAGAKYLYGAPSTPCSYIYLTNNYFHDNNVALGIGDKGSTIESGNTFSNNRVIRNMY